MGRPKAGTAEGKGNERNHRKKKREGLEMLKMQDERLEN